MSKVRVLMIEDEFIIAETIRATLINIGYDVVGHADSYDSAVAQIESSKPDIILLDVHIIGEKTGIDVGQHLAENYTIPFIYLTSFSDPDTVEKAKATRPSAYLTKPFDSGDLFTAIEIALHNFASGVTANAGEQGITSEDRPDVLIEDAIFIKRKNLFVKVFFKDILWLKSDGNYLEVKSTKDKLVVRSNFKEFTDRLGEVFYRCHRSYVINLEHLDAVNASYVLIQEDEIPLGRSFREGLMKRLHTSI